MSDSDDKLQRAIDAIEIEVPGLRREQYEEAITVGNLNYFEDKSIQYIGQFETSFHEIFMGRAIGYCVKKLK